MREPSTVWEDVVADIVGVHGIFNHRSDRESMHRAWSASIARGMHTRRTTRTDVTLECAFYGDYYNTGKAGGAGPLDVADLEPGLAQELLLELAAGAAPATVPATAPAEPTKAFGLGTLQAALRRLQEYELLDGATDAILRCVRQVDRYFSDRAFRGLVLEELGRAMDARPSVVVAHSLGSVAAYDWLRARPDAPAVTLVTLGSPLGFRGIRERLGAIGEPLAWPGCVTRWVNVADENDVVATVKSLRGVVDGEVDDRPTRSPVLRTHSAPEYLANPHTAKALVQVLG